MARKRIADWSPRRVIGMWLAVIGAVSLAAFAVTLLPDYIERPVLAADTAKVETGDSGARVPNINSVADSMVLADSVRNHEQEMVPNQAKETAGVGLALAAAVALLVATFVTSRWFALAKPHAHWRPVKLWFLWGLAIAVFLVASDAVSRDDRSMVYVLALPLSIVLVVITWTWLTTREQRDGAKPSS